MKYLTLILLLYVTNCFAQKLEVPIKDWKSFSIPKNRDTLISYNWSKTWWKVSLIKDEVFASVRNINHEEDLPFKTVPTKTEKVLNVIGERSVHKVDNGYLIGMNYGEWGGDLAWYSRLGGIHKNISGHQILKFLVLNSKIYALDGYGSIIEIIKTNDGWTTENYFKFPIEQKPISFVLDNQNNFIVITHDGILKVDKNKFFTKIADYKIWGIYLVPTSLVIKNEIIYVGMPMGVFKYNLNTKKNEWLMPK